MSTKMSCVPLTVRMSTPVKSTTSISLTIASPVTIFRRRGRVARGARIARTARVARAGRSARTRAARTVLGVIGIVVVVEVLRVGPVEDERDDLDRVFVLHSTVHRPEAAELPVD